MKIKFIIFFLNYVIFQHFKIDQQKEYLAKSGHFIGVGTPNRVEKLIISGKLY